MAQVPLALPSPSPQLDIQGRRQVCNSRGAGMRVQSVPIFSIKNYVIVIRTPVQTCRCCVGCIQQLVKPVLTGA